MSSPDPLSRARLAWMRRDAAATLQAAQPHCTATDPRVRARALVLCAEAMGELGHRDDALRLLQAALSTAPRLADAWTAVARLFQAAGRTSEAIGAWTRTTQLVPRDPVPWTALAKLHAADGQLVQAVTAIRHARQRAPLRADLARAEVEMQRKVDPRQAHAVLLAALGRFPTNVDLLLLVAEDFAEMARRDEALSHLDRAVAADPTHIVARSRRASFYIQSRRISDAEADLDVIFAQDPGHSHARLQRVRARMVAGDHPTAETLLHALLTEDGGPQGRDRGHALLYRAELRAKQGALADEWSDLCTGQALLAEPQLQRGEDGSNYLAAVSRRTQMFTPGSAFRTAAESWSTDTPEDAALRDNPPVFMFGFPRSGTTLAERILGAHPNLTATDELNLLGAVFHTMTAELGAPPTEKLTDAQVRHLRRAFMDKAVRAGFDPSSTRLIDKNPLNFVFIDVVRRVFPDSPVLMILRDPRDCVWSSFRQGFEPNPALVLTRDLAHTATLYRAVFDLWQVGRTLPGLRLTELHYEHLVTDFEAGARTLVDATGEPWDDAVLAFHTALGSAFVRTPSFAAVGQQVNKRRVGKWRRHAERFEAVAEVLAPYIDTLGAEIVAPDLL